MRILYVGEIVGRSGVYAIKKLLQPLRKEFRIDVAIGNADGATSGGGLGLQHAVYLRKLGLDILTLGECAFYKRDLVESMDKLNWVLRPANYPEGNPGKTYRVFRSDAGELAVVPLLGMTGFSRTHCSNPYLAVVDIGRQFKRSQVPVFIDFHASTTAEKESMCYHAAEHVCAIIGSHTRVQTADARIYAGCACLSDAGRTGSLDSVNGLDPTVRIREYLDCIPQKAHDHDAGLGLQGCVVEIDKSGRAVSIERISRSFAGPINDSNH